MEDCVKREMARNTILDMHCKSDDDGYVWILLGDAIRRIDNLPSVERKKGKWIGTDTKFGIRLYHCSECKADLMQLSLTNFCPNCGIKMEGEA